MERNEPRAVDAADLPLVRLTDVDELNLLTGRATDRELARFDLGDGVESGFSNLTALLLAIQLYMTLLTTTTVAPP